MKKAILLVSFGTTHMDTRKKTIDVIEERVKDRFCDYEVRTAFTSYIIIKRLKHRDGIVELTPEEALDKLLEDGFKEVIVQPLHIIPGEEYDYIKSVVAYYSNQGAFKKLELSRPALYFKGIEEELPDDYSIFVNAVKEHIPKKGVVLFMGHGSVHYSNACYSCLQNVFTDLGYEDVYIANVEGYPTLDNIINKLKRKNVKCLTLLPLMLVAGDHAKNDMAGDEEDSWKNILINEGIEVKIILRGLGELTEFQDIYLKHIEDCIDEKYKNIGKTKKKIKNRCLKYLEIK